MKKIFLLLLGVALLFFAGCGDGGDSSYDKYDDGGDSGIDNDNADTAPDKDQSDTSDEPSDADTEPQPDDEGEISDEEEPNDTDTPSPNDFWSTCEGIIACSNGCKAEDFDCVNNCYYAGSEEGQLHYRRWKECFDSNCAEEMSAECSAEKCAEWDEICNVAEAFDYELVIPAPYGTVKKLKGEFSYILNNVFPSSESSVVFNGFAEGNISSVSFPTKKTTISFVKKETDQRDGEVLDVYQAPFDTYTQKPGNPVVILRIKLASVTVGGHEFGVLDESKARLIVGEMDELYALSCYHAFGVGSFKIDEADIKIGSQSKFKFSGENIELFHPQNIPELGGDAREILGVEACSLIW